MQARLVLTELSLPTCLADLDRCLSGGCMAGLTMLGGVIISGILRFWEVFFTIMLRCRSSFHSLLNEPRAVRYNKDVMGLGRQRKC